MPSNSSASAVNWPVSEWFLKLPLYSPVDISANSSTAVKAILTFTASIDFYCPHCRKDTTYHGILSTETQNSIASEMMAAKGFGMSTASFWSQTVFSKELTCTRAGHAALFYFQTVQGKLFKVGQYPSIADIRYGEALDYAKALGEARIRDINKAIEMAANGNGLGGLCYLQKIWDALLADIHYKAQATALWDEEAYVTAGYAQKLSALVKGIPNCVPSYLLEHAELYEVLEKKWQTLSEAECLAKFDDVKLSVLLLADQKVAELRMKNRLMPIKQTPKGNAGRIAT